MTRRGSCIGSPFAAQSSKTPSERRIEAIVTSRTLAVACAKLCDDKKATDIVILDVRKITFIADYFVICTSTNERQSKAIAETLRMEMKKKGHLPINNSSQNGTSDGRWVLQDFGDVVVHVFNEEARKFYELDEVWADAKPVTWQRKKAAETPS